MNKIALNVNEKKQELSKLLEDAKYIVLATSADNRVTARTLCHVNIGLDIFFQTDSGFLKVEQIRKNPKVALCLNNMQIEGVAQLRGRPSEDQNAEFSDAFRKKHSRSYEKYAKSKKQITIKVSPALFVEWKYIDEKPCREYLDLEKNLAYREYYEINE